MTEDLLRATLRERADQTAYHPTPVDEVATTARGIRRRRRTASVLVAAAAVVAVTVPIAVVANRTDPDSAPSQPGPTGPVEQREGMPRIAYAVDGEIINPDGRRLTLQGDLGISAFTPYHPGYLVAGDQSFEGSTYLTHYDASGAVLESWAGAGLTVGADGTTAWSSFTPPESGHSVPTFIHRDRETQEVEQIKPTVVGLLDDQVVFNGGGGTPQAWITDLVDPPRPLATLQHATDTAAGLVAGQKDDTTAALIVAETGEELWSEPGTYAMGLSPDARYLHVMQDGLGQQDTIRDTRTGDVVTEIPGTGLSGLPGLHGLVWEDGTHLLGVLDGDVVRVALDGTTSVAVHVGLQEYSGVVFAAQP